jgi:heptosyltransferase-2
VNAALDARAVLVLAPNWLGDAVMALPALADIRRHWPDATLTVAARAGLAPLFECVPGVNARVPLGDGGGIRAVRTLGDDADRLRDRGHEVAVLLPNSFRAALLARQAGIPERWGYRTDLRGPLLTRSVRRQKGRLHQAGYYQALTDALGMARGPLAPVLRVTEEARAGAESLLRSRGWQGERLIGLAPGAAYGWAKRWPPERAGLLAGWVLRDLEARPLLVGARGDRATADEVRRAFERSVRAEERKGLIDLVGDTDLLTLAGVLSRCAAFVANDSGAMHLACALGVPVTATFGPTREWATAPLPPAGGPPPRILTHEVFCRPCMLRNCPIDHRCMTGISTDAVLGSVAAQVAGRAAESYPA